MKIHISIFSYQRKEELESLIREIKSFKYDITYSIFDDKSDYVLEDENFYQFEEHKGRQLFCQIYDTALRSCENINADIFIFMPSDFSLIDIERIINYDKKYNHIKNNIIKQSYCYNLIRDSRLNCWNMQKMKQIDEFSFQSWFCDGGFFSNKLLLDQIGYYMPTINQQRFKANPNISSGIGQYLTQRINNKKIKCYHPIKSLCFHDGTKPSTMHPAERLNNPLASI